MTPSRVAVEVGRAAKWEAACIANADTLDASKMARIEACADATSSTCIALGTGSLEGRDNDEGLIKGIAALLVAIVGSVPQPLRKMALVRDGMPTATGKPAL